MDFPRRHLVALDCPDPFKLATFYPARTGIAVGTWPSHAPDVDLVDDSLPTSSFQRVEDYSFSFAAIQKRMAVLERDVLVTKERRGEEQVMHANGPTIAKAIGLLDQYETRWMDRADRITDVPTTVNEGE